jgi:ammonia channel protein AmtB
LLTFAAAIPAIISGGTAERAKFGPQLIATAVIVGVIYPFLEGIAWNQAYGIQAWLKGTFGEEFHDFAGSVVVHGMGVWPLHGVCGAWGGLAAGIFGSKAAGGLGGVAFMPQLLGTVAAIVVAVVGGYLVYEVLQLTMGLRLSPEE